MVWAACALAATGCDDGGGDDAADGAADAQPMGRQDMRAPEPDMRVRPDRGLPPPVDAAVDMGAMADASETDAGAMTDAAGDAGEPSDAEPTVDGGPLADAGVLDAQPDAAPEDSGLEPGDMGVEPDDMGVEPSDMGPPPGPRRYVVTIQNLSDQPLGPVVAATHPADLHLWQPGELASPGIRVIAEMGVPFTFYDEVQATDGVTQVVNAGVPMTPRGTTRDSFGPFPPGETLTDNVSFVIEGNPGDTLSLASMVVITNDGFWGLDGVELPAAGTRAYLADAYDAGTEENTELAADLDDGGSILGPVALPGDPNGNRRVPTEPPARITPHPGIAGVGDLTVEDHGFGQRVARVLITALPDDLEAYAVVTENLTSQPMGPSLGATHAADTHLWQVGALASPGVEIVAEMGSTALLATEAANAAGVTFALESGLPMTPQGTLRDSFGPFPPGIEMNDRSAWHVAGGPGDVFSLASMLVATNDGFWGFDGVELPVGGASVTLEAMGYDAGTEENTELSADLDDASSILGKVMLPGDPNGNAGTETDPRAPIAAHGGILGVGQLDYVNHGWDLMAPVARVTLQHLAPRADLRCLEGGACPPVSPPVERRRYVVTMQNLTVQPLGPVVAATHAPATRLWQVGQPASPGIKVIAEMGVPFTFYDEAAATDGVTEVVNAGVPMTPRGETRPGFGPFPAGATLRDHVSFVVEGAPGDVLSLASMVVITNDGFWGLDSVALPETGTRVYFADAYDAGTEENTELATDLDDGGSILGLVPLPGDPNGNANPATEPAQPIAPHPGITGAGDLTLESHGWGTHVARVIVTALPPGTAAYEVVAENLTPQPMGPSATVTHAPAVHLWRAGQPASPGIEIVAEMGSTALLLNEVRDAMGVTLALDSGLPIAPQGTLRTTFGPFPPDVELVDHSAWHVFAAAGDVLSLASMLVATNDGFWGLDAVALPGADPIVYDVRGYDAGTEENSELSADLDDASSILGTVMLPGDPNGNAGTATEPPAPITLHGGIAGGGDLTAMDHGFDPDAPVARVTVRRVSRRADLRCLEGGACP